MIWHPRRDTKGRGLPSAVFSLSSTKTLLLLSLGCLALALLGQASAQGLHGQLSSELYSYRDSSVNHVRPYFRLVTGASPWSGAGNRTLEFHVNTRWTTDADTKRPTDPQLYVYDAYVHAANFVGRSDAYLGRQFFYNGIGSGLVDGLRLKSRITSALQFDFFGGSGVTSADPEKIQPLSASILAGGRVTAKPVGRLNLGLNWLYRKTDGCTDLHRAGLDLDESLARWRLYGRVVYDISWRRLGDITSRVSYAGEPWYLSVEGSWREPSVAAASIFSLLDFERYQIIRIDGRRSIGRNFAVTTNLFSRFQSGEDSYSLGLGLAKGPYAVGWHYQNGSAGDNSGVHGSASVRLAPRWNGYVAANLSRYRVQEEADQSDAYTSQVGLVWRPATGWSAAVEGQLLRNAIATSQGRFYFRLTKDFAANPIKGGNG